MLYGKTIRNIVIALHTYLGRFHTHTQTYIILAYNHPLDIYYYEYYYYYYIILCSHETDLGFDAERFSSAKCSNHSAHIVCPTVKSICIYL